MPQQLVHACGNVFDPDEPNRLQSISTHRSQPVSAVMRYRPDPGPSFPSTQ